INYKEKFVKKAEKLKESDNEKFKDILAEVNKKASKRKKKDKPKKDKKKDDKQKKDKKKDDKQKKDKKDKKQSDIKRVARRLYHEHIKKNQQKGEKYRETLKRIKDSIDY